MMKWRTSLRIWNGLVIIGLSFFGVKGIIFRESPQVSCTAYLHISLFYGLVLDLERKYMRQKHLNHSNESRIIKIRRVN